MKSRLLRYFGLAFGVLFFFMALPSCLKKPNMIVLVDDLQEIPFITDYLPKDLLDLYGEENVFFGNQPPVVNMEFVSNHIYVTTKIPNLPSNHAPQPGGVSPITRYHKISNQHLQIAEYIGMSSEEAYCQKIDTIYLTGSGNDFTAYFHETPQVYGKPEYAVLFSGTLTDDGIKGFRYGFEILKYNDSIDPHIVHPVGSIFILGNNDSIAEAHTWYDDSLMNHLN